MRRRIEKYRYDIDTFFLGLGWGTKGEEAEQLFNNRLAKSSLKIAVNEARDTEGSTGLENRQTSR